MSPMERPPPPRQGGGGVLGTVAGLAQATVESLKGQPALVVIAIINCVFIITLAWLQHAATERRGELLRVILENCLKTREH